MRRLGCMHCSCPSHLAARLEFGPQPDLESRLTACIAPRRILKSSASMASQRQTSTSSRQARTCFPHFPCDFD